MQQQGEASMVEPCDICGSACWPAKIVTCSKCNITREHCYCMRNTLTEIPDYWLCESCRSENELLKEHNFVPQHKVCISSAVSKATQRKNTEDSSQSFESTPHADVEQLSESSFDPEQIPLKKKKKSPMKLDKGKEKQKENRKDKGVDEEEKETSSDEEAQTPSAKGTPRPVPLKKKKTGASQIARKNYALRVKHVAPKRKKLKKSLPKNVDVQILDSSSKYVAALTTVEKFPPHTSHEEEDREPSISFPQEEPLNEEILSPTKSGEPVQKYGGEKNKKDAKGQQNEEPTPPPTNQEAKHQHREEPVASNPPPDNTSVDVPLGESNKDHSKINKESEVQVDPHLEKQTEVVVPDPASQVNITSNPSETMLSSSGKSQMPSNLKECLEVLDENPFAVLEFLTGEGSMPSANFNSRSYQPSNKNVQDHLESLRNLVFEYSFLELLPIDVEYQYRIQKEFETLSTFQKDLTPDQIKGLDSLKTLFDQALEILREHQEISQKASDVMVEKDDMLEKLKDSRNKMSKFNESLGTLSHQITEVDDKKKVIKERMKKLREEEEQLLKDEENYKASMTRLETRKLELLTNVKCVSSELVKASKNLQNLEAKDASLLRQYDGLKQAYQPLREWPPF